jgi:hypothetical protein
VLVIQADQGSAKSTLAKVLRQLIDPNVAPVLAEARSIRDLMVSAANGWLLAYDNISKLPNWLSDGLCRLATGGGAATRALYSNKEQSVIYAQRPIILNGIDEFVRKPDLADRAVFLNPPIIADSQRREESESWASFAQAQPRILGGLLDVVVGALRELPSVQLAALPRMADFARFGEAAGRGLGWPEGSFVDAYRNNRRSATLSKLDESPVGTAILNLLDRYGPSFDWVMPPAEVLEVCAEAVDKEATASARWPKTTIALGIELRRIAPLLREHGLFVSFSRNNRTRAIRITTKVGAGDSTATLRR